jgi:hypothetical protein
LVSLRAKTEARDESTALPLRTKKKEKKGKKPEIVKRKRLEELLFCL